MKRVMAYSAKIDGRASLWSLRKTSFHFFNSIVLTHSGIYRDSGSMV